MTTEDSIFEEYCLCRGSTYSMYLIDISVIRGINVESIILDVVKLVEEGFAIDIEDALYRLRSDALQHL